MPFLRRFGNMMLSFLAKAATGYWNCFDPTNGYIAIRGDVLAQLPMHRIDRTYFFETSVLARLYLLGALAATYPCGALRERIFQSGHSQSAQGVPGPPADLFLQRIVLKKFIYA